MLDLLISCPTETSPTKSALETPIWVISLLFSPPHEVTNNAKVKSKTEILLILI